MRRGCVGTAAASRAGMYDGQGVGLVGLVQGRIGQTQDAGPNLNTPGKGFNYDGSPLVLLSLVTLYLSRL